MSGILQVMVVWVHNLTVVRIDDGDVVLAVAKIVVVMFGDMGCIIQFLALAIEHIGVHLPAGLEFEEYTACKSVVEVIHLVVEHHCLECSQQHNILQVVVGVVVLIVDE